MLYLGTDEIYSVLSSKGGVKSRPWDQIANTKELRSSWNGWKVRSKRFQNLRAGEDVLCKDPPGYLASLFSTPPQSHCRAPSSSTPKSISASSPCKTTSIFVRKASNPPHEQQQNEQDERPTGLVLHRFDLLKCTAYDNDWGGGSRELQCRKHRGWLYIGQSKWCTYFKYARTDRPPSSVCISSWSAS